MVAGSTAVEMESQEVASKMEEAVVGEASPEHVAVAVALRCGAVVASLAAALLVLTNRQQRRGVEVNFTMFQVWVAFVATNLLCAAYALLTAIFLRKLVGRHWLHMLDQAMANLESAATAGAGAVGSVAMWGNEVSGWFPVCRLYRRYCNVGAVSLGLSFAAVLSLGGAAALSRYPRKPAARH